MPPGISDIVALPTLVSTLLIMIGFWKRPWLGVALAMVIMIFGWIILCRTNEADVTAELQEIQARYNRGEKLPPEDMTYDGCGDRVVILVMGWYPGGVGIVLGSLVSFFIRRVKRRPDNVVHLS